MTTATLYALAQDGPGGEIDLHLFADRQSLNSQISDRVFKLWESLCQDAEMPLDEFDAWLEIEERHGPCDGLKIETLTLPGSEDASGASTQAAEILVMLGHKAFANGDMIFLQRIGMAEVLRLMLDLSPQLDRDHVAISTATALRVIKAMMMIDCSRNDGRPWETIWETV